VANKPAAQGEPSGVVRGFQWALAGFMLLVSAVMFLPPGLTGMGTISPQTLAKRLDVAPGGLTVVDVRTGGEFGTGHIEGAISAPVHALPFRLADLPEDREREVVLVCMSGHRSRLAGLMLRLAGYSNLTNLDGGMLHWKQAGQPAVL